MSEEAQADVTIYTGETANIRVTVVDQAGDPKNLTGATIEFRIGSTRYDTFQLSKAGSLVNDGSDGLIQVDLTTVETAALTNLMWDFQFLATDSDSDVQVVKEGLIDVKPVLPTS